eukprot:GHVR01012141.1.p1 GENE.GHVR01012141.1~~GHVR01012141.1.p1  ORF type:complete len:801 (-),score=133.50 GHVR01012141.1:119-2521(-)
MREFWIEDNCIKWKSPKKTLTKTTIHFDDIIRVMPGCDSDFFKTRAESDTSIDLNAKPRLLRFTCSSPVEWKMWMVSITSLIDHLERARIDHHNYVSEYVRKQWALSDVDGSGSLSEDEVFRLMARLNITASKSWCKHLLKTFDKDENGLLEFNEFHKLINHLLISERFAEQFEIYMDKVTLLVSEKDYTRFLVEVQRTPKEHLESELDLMRMMSPPFLENGGLTRLGFCVLLMSERNSLLRPQCRYPHQDMTRPLSDYWISTSHNTYLEGDQLVGKSTVSQYIEVLNRGCRCVELDCWDGPDGEPVIYHGHTFTSKIKFEDVVQACKDWGHTHHVSPYPLILSIEMHCCDSQKLRVGEILEDLLGDMLWRHPTDDGTGLLPSPELAKNKILVKGKVRVGGSLFEQDEGNEDDLLEEEEEVGRVDDLYATLKELKSDTFKFNALSSREETPPPVSVQDASAGGGSAEPSCREPSRQASRLNTTRTRSGFNSRRRNTVLQTAKLQTYYNTCFLRGCKLDITTWREREASSICSLSEAHFLKLLKNNQNDMFQFHRKYLSRVYPSGTRVTSTNYNPVIPWIIGTQLVALNFQHLGLPTMLNEGRFLENGGRSCGYVLKPPCLRGRPDDAVDILTTEAALQHRDTTPATVIIKVCAASQLPKPALQHRGDIVDPFVCVRVDGAPQDCAKYTTPHVEENGFNPQWIDQVFTFHVTVPSVALLTFEIRDMDRVRTTFIAGASLPMSCIRPGLRSVNLFDHKFNKIPWASLQVHVDIRQYKENDPNDTVQQQKRPEGRQRAKNRRK